MLRLGLAFGLTQPSTSAARAGAADLQVSVDVHGALTEVVHANGALVATSNHLQVGIKDDAAELQRAEFDTLVDQRCSLSQWILPPWWWFCLFGSTENSELQAAKLAGSAPKVIVIPEGTIVTYDKYGMVTAITLDGSGKTNAAAVAEWASSMDIEVDKTQVQKFGGEWTTIAEDGKLNAGDQIEVDGLEMAVPAESAPKQDSQEMQAVESSELPLQPEIIEPPPPPEPTQVSVLTKSADTGEKMLVISVHDNVGDSYSVQMRGFSSAVTAGGEACVVAGSNGVSLEIIDDRLTGLKKITSDARTLAALDSASKANEVEVIIFDEQTCHRLEDKIGPGTQCYIHAVGKRSTAMTAATGTQVHRYRSAVFSPATISDYSPSVGSCFPCPLVDLSFATATWTVARIGSDCPNPSPSFVEQGHVVDASFKSE